MNMPAIAPGGGPSLARAAGWRQVGRLPRAASRGNRPMSDPTHIIAGGGSAGCTLAARLSENPANQVLLIEAGPDYGTTDIPDDISDTYAHRAMTNTAYFWPALRAS